MDGKQDQNLFFADAMLGRLARWLRILGVDTIYLGYHENPNTIRKFRERRILLTRSKDMLETYPESIFIHSDHVNEQLNELINSGFVNPDPQKRFSRCIECNTRLESATPEAASGSVPEYVLHQYKGRISLCPRCNRFIWPGSHRQRMERQLRVWGIGSDPPEITEDTRDGCHKNP